MILHTKIGQNCFRTHSFLSWQPSENIAASFPLRLSKWETSFLKQSLCRHKHASLSSTGLSHDSVFLRRVVDSEPLEPVSFLHHYTYYSTFHYDSLLYLILQRCVGMNPFQELRNTSSNVWPWVLIISKILFGKHGISFPFGYILKCRYYDYALRIGCGKTCCKVMQCVKRQTHYIALWQYNSSKR